MICLINVSHDKWIPVSTAWCVLGMWMEERPPICRVSANIYNKQSRRPRKDVHPA